MSQASASRTIRFAAKSGTYTAIINCPTGDIYQYWTGTESNPAVSYPDLRMSQPELQFIVVSSRVSEGETIPELLEVYVNESRALWVAADGEQTSWNGLLQLVKPSTTEGASDAEKRWRIKVINNFVNATPPILVPLTIRVVGKVSYGAITDDVSAVTQIKIGQDTGSIPNRVVIVDGGAPSNSAAGHNFIFTANNQDIVLKAQIQTSDGLDTAGNYIYEWAIAGANPITGAAVVDSWQVLSETGNSITINEKEIVSAAEVRVMAYKNNGGARGTFVGIDFQTLTDATDPLMVKPYADPADETIEEDNTRRSSVKYTPVLTARSGAAVASQPDFRFILTGPAGVCMKDVTLSARTYFEVEYRDAVQANGDMNLVIMAEDSSTPTT